jgi:hypothetical protein
MVPPDGKLCQPRPPKASSSHCGLHRVRGCQWTPTRGVSSRGTDMRCSAYRFLCYSHPFSHIPPTTFTPSSAFTGAHSPPPLTLEPRGLHGHPHMEMPVRWSFPQRLGKTRRRTSVKCLLSAASPQCLPGRLRRHRRAISYMIVCFMAPHAPS